MSQRTSIEWTDVTWNPVHGCSVVSPGCAHCYAATLSLRYGHTKKPWTPANAAENVILKPHKLREPLSWREPRMVFVNSMSDLFHEEIPPSYVWQCLDVMREAERHTFQVLTKRPERMRQLVNAWYALSSPLGEAPAAPNIWLGVSIENRRFVDRADVLRETHAAVRFISAEPLLGPLVGHEPAIPRSIPIQLDLTTIDWLIAGGESGQHHRRLDLEWVRQLRDECAASGTAFFVKQLGGARPGTKLEDLPEDLRIREFPRALERVA